MPNQKKVNQKFDSGVNRRTSRRRGKPNEFHTLQNARLQERGNTFEVSRIDGFQAVQNSSTNFDHVYDSLFWNNDLVVLWYDNSSNKVHVTFVDIDGNGEKNFNFSAPKEEYSELNLSDETILITGYRRQLSFYGGQWYLSKLKSEIPKFDITLQSGGDLDPTSVYWYKIRYIYEDGHKTKTTYPQHVKPTNTNQKVKITVNNIPTDVDNDLADIQVFRKKGGGDWFLIKDVEATTTPFDITDSNLPPSKPLEEQNYVWFKDARTGDIVQNRYVLGNLEYEDRTYNVNFDVSTYQDNQDYTLPNNTKMDIYVQVKYEDGTISPHKFLDTITISENDNFQVTSNSLPTSNFEISDVAFFGQIRDSESDGLTFKSVEIYNRNVASLATKYKTGEKDKPANPHIFLGYKYIRIVTHLQNQEWTIEPIIIDQDWDYDRGNNTYKGTPDLDTSPGSSDDSWGIDYTLQSIDDQFGANIRDIFIEGRDGTQIKGKYKLKYTASLNDGGYNYYIYENVLCDSLKSAVSNGECSVKLSSLSVSQDLSDVKSNEEFIGREVEVIDLLDTSEGSPQQVYDNLLYNTGKNHLYLVLESGTIFDNFDNPDVNTDSVLADYDDDSPAVGYKIPKFVFPYEFEILNTQYGRIQSVSQSSSPLGNNVTKYDVDFSVIKKSTITSDIQELLYLGQSSPWTGTTKKDWFDGFKKEVNNQFLFQSLSEAAIFKSRVEPLEMADNSTPNQIIFSEPNIPNSDVGGFRNFNFKNFKNITGEYGDILKIKYFNNKLFVFCERGLNVILVGQVLTQQVGGEVFVDSSNLLNNDSWLLTSVQQMQADSVVQYENMLFFCDGKDVWMHDGSLQNISNGKVPINHTKPIVGNIDPQNKEYVISVGNKSWVYSIELGLWQGPYNYKLLTSSPFQDNFYGVVGNNVVEFNKGNTFNGQNYETILESVGNDLNAPLITKRFRKFYLETRQDARFYWGKDPTNMSDRKLSSLPNKNGIIYSGIDPRNVNGEYLYWKIKTDKDKFLLSSIGFMYNPRNRR